MRLPASLTPLAIAAAIITGAIVAAVAGLSGGNAVMPGALHAVDPSGDAEQHGGVRAHAEIDDCGRCHPGMFASQTASDLCLSCHDDITAELRDKTSRHGRLEARGHCLRCHTEHRGADGELTRVDRDDFDHEATGFSLKAHHKTKAGATFRCADCHHGDTDHFDPGECERCHRADDAPFVTRHVAAWGAACRACHDGVDRFTRGVFDHGRTPFPLVGKHATVACERCHAGARSLPAYKQAATTCAGCHAKDDVHAGRLGTACATCHTADGWKAIIAGSFDHARTRFPLTGAHVEVACDKCHWNGRLQGTPRSCELCHERPRDHFPGACDQCHTTSRWKGARRPRTPATPPSEPTPSPTPDTTTTASPRSRR